jgi:hypothetical protein
MKTRFYVAPFLRSQVETTLNSQSRIQYAMGDSLPNILSFSRSMRCEMAIIGDVSGHSFVVLFASVTVVETSGDWIFSCLILVNNRQIPGKQAHQDSVCLSLEKLLRSLSLQLLFACEEVVWFELSFVRGSNFIEGSFAELECFHRFRRTAESRVRSLSFRRFRRTAESRVRSLSVRRIALFVRRIEVRYVFDVLGITSGSCH